MQTIQRAGLVSEKLHSTSLVQNRLQRSGPEVDRGLLPKFVTRPQTLQSRKQPDAILAPLDKQI